MWNDPYVSLAERIVFSGLNKKELEKIATYKEGKGWKDFMETYHAAMREYMGKSFEGQMRGVASQIKEIIEIKLEDKTIPPLTPQSTK